MGALPFIGRMSCGSKVFMLSCSNDYMSYTTIRLSVKDKEKLEKLARKLGKNLSETLRYAITVAEKESDNFRGDLDKVLSTLKHGKDIGATNAERVDEYLYGGSN